MPVAIINPKASSFAGCSGSFDSSGEGAAAILQRWSELGGSSTLGCPTAAARAVGASVQQSFEHGGIESQSIDGFQDDTLAAWSYPDDPNRASPGGRMHVSWSGGPVYFEYASRPELGGWIKYLAQWLGDEDRRKPTGTLTLRSLLPGGREARRSTAPTGRWSSSCAPRGGNDCTVPLTVSSFAHAPPQLAPQRDPASAISTLGSRVQAVAATFACQSGYTGSARTRQ